MQITFENMKEQLDLIKCHLNLPDDLLEGCIIINTPSILRSLLFWLLFPVQP